MPVDLTDLKRLESRLLKLNKTGFRIAQEKTINDMAFKTRQNAVEHIKKEFTTRNHFTTSGRTLKVDKATRTTRQAVVGHTEAYMRDQEHGFQKRPDKYTDAVAIPTPVASGERRGVAAGKTIRKKPVRKVNRKNMLKMPSDKMRAVPRRQRNAALIQEAIKTKRRFIELERNGESSIYRVRGNKKRYQLDRLYKTEHKTLTIKPSPWLAPSANKAMKQRDKFYMARLDYQVKRMMK
jgi:hypothetical protein